jgi:hypothetical protein
VRERRDISVHAWWYLGEAQVFSLEIDAGRAGPCDTPRTCAPPLPPVRDAASIAAPAARHSTQQRPRVSPPRARVSSYPTQSQQQTRPHNLSLTTPLPTCLNLGPHSGQGGEEAKTRRCSHSAEVKPTGV